MARLLSSLIESLAVSLGWEQFTLPDGSSIWVKHENVGIDGCPYEETAKAAIWASINPLMHN